MTEATKRLRDPAALALVAFVVVELVLSIFDLLVGAGTTFSYRAAESALSILDVTHVGALVGALVLVYMVGEQSRYAGLVTQIALGAFGASLLFGVIAVCAALASDASGHARTDVFLNGVVLLVVFAVGAWFTWLVYQRNAPAKPAPQAGWPAPQPGYQPWAGGQQGGQGAQQAQGYQPPPGGFGWTQQAPQQQPVQPMPSQGAPDMAATQAGGHAPMQNQPQPTQQPQVQQPQAQAPMVPQQPPAAGRQGDGGTQVMPAVDEPNHGVPAQGGPQGQAPQGPAQGAPAPWSPTIGGVQPDGQAQTGSNDAGDSGGAWRPAG